MLLVILVAAVAAVTGALGAWSLLRHGVRGRIFALYVAAIMFMIALIVPFVLLRRFSIWWLAFAMGVSVLTYGSVWLNWSTFSLMWQRDRNDIPW